MLKTNILNPSLPHCPAKKNCLFILFPFFFSFDDGSYKHDDTGDYGPYHYWKLRKQAWRTFFQRI